MRSALAFILLLMCSCAADAPEEAGEGSAGSSSATSSSVSSARASITDYCSTKCTRARDCDFASTNDGDECESVCKSYALALRTSTKCSDDKSTVARDCVDMLRVLDCVYFEAELYPDSCDPLCGK